MLSARAEFLADTSELALTCAECFCMARCAGSDIKAIGMSAKAALALGAEQDWLAMEAPPFGEDRDYIDETATIRVAIKQHAAQVQALIQDAIAEARRAAAEMAAAMRERNWPRYDRALRVYLDATHAISICQETLSALGRADRCLAWAPVRFAQVYEGPEAFVGQGGQLPHEGRWFRAEHLTGGRQ